MIEKIKSLILIILVILSLFLTYQLWYGQQPAELVAEDVYERIVVERPQPIEEVFNPAFMTIPVENGYYVLNDHEREFIDVWAFISKSLQMPADELLIESSMITGEEGRLLTLYFEPGLPTGPQMPWLKEYPEKIVQEIKIITKNNGLWLIAGDINDDLIYIESIRDEKMERLFTSLQSIYESERDLYFLLSEDMFVSANDRELILPKPVFLPIDPVSMDRILLAHEVIDRDLVLKTFFVDYNLARVIEEKDGGLIYTDGEKGLRLTPVSLEYSNPRLEDSRATLSYADALYNSNNLISYHGGWPDGLRLESLETSGWGDALSFKAQWRIYNNGYRLYTAIPTKIIFNDRGLVHYSRSLYTAQELYLAGNEAYPTAVWHDALEAAVKLYEAELSGPGAAIRLEAMHLAYAVLLTGNDYYGEPIWYIQLNGERYLLKADTLTQIREEVLQ
ncbi:MAG: two-component system activity regulator YycH [Bacillota bacterium]|nr:two-component system activity regulator YycH [Bacillota bacterium]